MKHASLFSGIGGFDLAAQWMGWTNVFSCEIEEFPRKILQHHFPNTIHYEDIKRTDFTIHRGEVDVLSGGFPCQPYSMAGKRLGKNDERHLWPEMLRAIREINPRFVVGENVRGLLSWNAGVVLDEVYADLEGEGYEVFTFVLPAASINAPHKRDRAWIIAKRNAPNTDNAGAREPMSIERDWSQNDQGSQGQSQFESWQEGGNGDAADTSLTGKRQDNRQGESELLNKDGSRRNWQDFPTQSPICGGDDGLPRELDGITFPKWRNESIKAYGNAIVPQVAYRIFQAIQQTEQQYGQTHDQL